MLSINRIMITGRLTRDPETKYLPSGSAVTMLGMAVNRRYPDKSGEWREETFFLDVETWGKLAERCAEVLKKGRPVYVEGRLKIDTWEREGQKQYKTRINADRVTPFDVPARPGEGGEMTAEEGDVESYGSHSSHGASRPHGRPASGSSGAPSDHLDFGEGGIQDDIPF